MCIRDRPWITPPSTPRSATALGWPISATCWPTARAWLRPGAPWRFSTIRQAIGQATTQRAALPSVGYASGSCRCCWSWPAAFHFGPARHPNLQAFGRTRPEDVATLVYWLALLVWAVCALVGITRSCWRLSSATSSELVSPTSLELSSRPSPGSTRVGLRLIAAGAFVVLIRFGYQYGIYFSVPAFGSGRPAVVGQEVMHVLNVAALLAGGIMALGAGLPAWVCRARAIQRWRAHHRDFRTLAPLRFALREGSPTIASSVQRYIRDRLA